MKPTTNQPVAVFDFRQDDTFDPQRLCFANPLRIIVAESINEVRPALQAAELAAKEGLYAVGYVSYEAAPAFDSALRVQTGARMPLVWFAIFKEPTAIVFPFNVRNPPAIDHPSAVAAPGTPVAGGTDIVTDTNSPPTLDGTDIEWQPSVSRASYRKNIGSIRDAIARGDTYQVNYTMRLRSKFEGDGFSLYEPLRTNQRSNYCAYLDTGRFRILSASPELFFRRTGNRIVMRPMKGTAARGRWTDEDDAQGAHLATSEKDRAENVMIVDLVRSDLGRVAVTGSVHVPALFTIERYPTVFQMTSTVEARLKDEIMLEEIFTALFPSGSVTGAPKVSTMRLIADLEDSPREVYCGSIGLVKPDGDCTFNVAIRTVVINSETGAAEYGIGGGITWASTAESEYEEALAKATVLTHERPAFDLLETLKLEDCKYALLERHLERLAGSARYFDIPLRVSNVKKALDDHAAAYCHEPRRVRLLVSPDGEIRVESESYEALGSTSVPVRLARKPISRRNRMLYHKTTDRQIYDQLLVDPHESLDTLLWNEEDELTEFTRGNLVVEMDGRLWTPPIECGLLPGTFRAELLESGEIAELVIQKSELSSATRVWFINSVRGWVPVEVVS